MDFLVHARGGPEECHEDVERTEAPLLKQAERVRIVLPREEKALGIGSCRKVREKLFFRKCSDRNKG